MIALEIRRASESYAILSGPRDTIAAIAESTGLRTREPVSDRLLVILGEEAELAAACAAFGYDVRPTCSLCEAGVCCVHRGQR